MIAGTEHGCALVLQKYFDNSPGDFFDSVDRAVQRGNAGLALASLGAVLTRAESGAHLSAVVQSSLWSSLLSSLKFGQEPAPFVLGLWVVNLLLPHVTAALPATMIGIRPPDLLIRGRSLHEVFVKVAQSSMWVNSVLLWHAAETISITQARRSAG